VSRPASARNIQAAAAAPRAASACRERKRSISGKGSFLGEVDGASLEAVVGRGGGGGGTEESLSESDSKWDI
jgi:hypothetical protein